MTGAGVRPGDDPAAPDPAQIAVGPVTVLGWSGDPLPARGLDAVAAAGLVVGSSRLLQALGLADDARALVLGARGLALSAALDRTVEAVAAGAGVVVLASGDPGFFGVVRALRERGLAPVVVPAVSSVARAFAALGMTWDDALVVTAHGRDARPALAAARAHPKVAVLTAAGPADAEHLVAELVAAGRSVHVAERLGHPDQRLAGPSEAPYAEPNVVLSLAATAAGPGQAAWRAGAPEVPDGWALPEDAFEHRDSMITKAEVRALVLAHLAPRTGTTVWDVGAGCGSVAVECARFGADVLALEQDGDQCERVRRNADRHGVRVEMVRGRAPQALTGLRDPDSAFVGGGGLDVVTAVAARTARRLVVTLAAVERVGPVMASLSDAGWAVDAVQLQASRLAALPDGTHRLAATNPVTVVRGVRA